MSTTNVPEDFIKLQRKFIADYLLNIKAEQRVVEALNNLTKSSRDQVCVYETALQDVVEKVFKECVVKESALDHFLKQKPNHGLWYEKYPDNLTPLVIMISALLQGKRGIKSDRVNNYRLQFNSAHELNTLWPTIQGDLEKILKDFFNITPFLENQDIRNSFARSICFVVNDIG